MTMGIYGDKIDGLTFSDYHDSTSKKSWEICQGLV
jgi:hypothetical protein